MDSDPNKDKVADLQRIWNSEPGRYWEEFRTSGLSAEEVWPGQGQERVPYEPSRNLPLKKR